MEHEHDTVNTPAHNGTAAIYANVILPIKFKGEITYLVPAIYQVQSGTRVMVDFAGKLYSGVVHKLLTKAQLSAPKSAHLGTQSAAQTTTQPTPLQSISYKPILAIESLPLVSQQEISFWEQVANYYLCSIGEVFKAAYTSTAIKQEGVKPRKTVAHFLEDIGTQPKIQCPELSPAQNNTFFNIQQQTKLNPQKPILLKGVTGSGKTEIYINLAEKQLSGGKNVLYMVPEIALSKQLYNRLKKVFGERLLTFHSKQTAAEKARIQKILTYSNPSTDSAVILLGTRSALFLPYNNLGMIIVDEEHDTSYKQSDPAPRYHARDAAIMLAGIHKAEIILGSATPSFESEYNCTIERFTKVELTEKFYGAIEPQVDIINTIWAYKSRQMVGSFSQKLINEIKKTIDNQGQVLIFRNRRSYSPIVTCTECGNIPKCPHCNVYLSYHKYDHTLRCHYCDHISPFNGICPKCGLDTLQYKGAGTEKLEEELKTLFPDSNISRYDADIAKNKKSEEQVIKDFAEGRTNILIGTQMISKGFDFERLNLVAVMQADTILGIQDFRADEKALQLFNQLMGRTGRRGTRGKLIIQTNQKDHPVIEQIRENALDVTTTNTLISNILSERREFNFAPYVRMVKIIVKHKNQEKLTLLCNQIETLFQPTSNSDFSLSCREFTGPFIPPIDKIRGEYIKCFYVKFARDGKLSANKEALLKALESLRGYQSVIIDVDPY